MSVLTNELIEEQQDSAELYTFTYNGANYGYTSYVENLNKTGSNPNLFLAIPIKRTSFSLNTSLEPVKLSLTMNFKGTLFEPLMSDLYQPVDLKIEKCLVSNPNDTTTKFTGRLQSYSINRQNISMNFIGGCHELLRSIPTAFVQSLCNNILFDSTCSLQKELYKVRAKVDEINSVLVNGVPNLNRILILSDSEPDSFGENFSDKGNDYFAYGTAKWSNNQRYVARNWGSSVLLEYASTDLQVGDVIDLFPGCGKLASVCVEKFDNLTNFTGMPYVPTLSPLRWGIRIQEE